MSNCKICGDDMTNDGVVHPRLDCEPGCDTCMACCATVAKSPIHIGYLIAWYHRGRNMDRLNNKLSIIADAVQTNSQFLSGKRGLGLAVIARGNNVKLQHIYQKLSYYWEQFSNDQTI